MNRKSTSEFWNWSRRKRRLGPRLSHYVSSSIKQTVMACLLFREPRRDLQQHAELADQLRSRFTSKL